MVTLAKFVSPDGGERLMTITVRDIALPVELCEKAEQRFRPHFDGVEQLLTFVLEELLRDEATELDLGEQQMVEQRLKDLGYI